MKHTDNYNLPQWELNDRVLMEDFNAAMATLDKTISQHRYYCMCDNLDIGDALKKHRDAINAAQKTADEAMTVRTYATGTYTGDGGTQSISLGFKPSFLIISGMLHSQSNSTITDFDRYFAMTAGNVLDKRVKLTSTGFTVYPAPYQYMNNPKLNDEGRVYDYIAFK